jgi:hypothetical protein
LETGNGAIGLTGLQRARSEGLETEFKEWGKARCAAKNGGEGLLRKILAEDYDEFSQAHRTTLAVNAVDQCDKCDDSGFYDEGDYRYRCVHEVMA